MSAGFDDIGLIRMTVLSLIVILFKFGWLATASVELEAGEAASGYEALLVKKGIIEFCFGFTCFGLFRYLIWALSGVKYN